MALPAQAQAQAQAQDVDAEARCAPVPAAGPPSIASLSKRDAILGGAPSRLLQISAQQAGDAPAAPLIAPPSAFVTQDCAAATPAFRPAIAMGTRAGDPPRTGMPDVFGSVALAVSRTPLDANWRRVRHAHVGAGPWSAVLGAARARDRAAQIAAVNSWVNARIAFVEDRLRYGVEDRWALPAESLSSGRGDCEDYAIAKFALLQKLGIPGDDMYLVIARDLVRRADHAVLAVKLGERLVILDNQTDRILDAAEVRDYRPVMSYAGDRAWTHGYRVDPMTAPLRTASVVVIAGR